MITLFVKITTTSDQELWVGMNGNKEIRLFITNATDPDNCKPLSRDNRPDVEKQFGDKAFEEAFAVRGFIECMLYSDEPLKELEYIQDSLSKLKTAVKTWRTERGTKRDTGNILHVAYEIDDLLSRVRYPCTYRNDMVLEQKRLDAEDSQKENTNNA
jgi:hypothetical protein